MANTVYGSPTEFTKSDWYDAVAGHLMRSLATEWGEHEIRVHALLPGYIQTSICHPILV